MAIRSTPDPWAPVRGQRAVMLTTYRRDGRSVATPVGYGIDGTTLYFMTDPGTGKVKRLRHTPAVSLAASTLRGAVRGPAVTGMATEITGAEADQGRRHITSSNRLAWFFLQRKARRAGWDWVVYAVRRDQPDDQSANDQTANDRVDVDDTMT
ncbi:MAG TPA: PPOX class F420-dependent oxidoreductase, partial [Microlunatus sp.]|nr:PPOX class F420-dependent oxidoreductase [Microlunatus sp.]